jgi:hypothetical protein
MSCYISSGVQLGCSDGIGGIKEIFIVGGGGSITGLTYDATSAITGGTATSGTTIYAFQVKRNTSSLTQNITKSYENGTVFYDQELKVVFYKYDQAKRDQVLILSQNDQLQIIAVDFLGTQYYLGQTNGMFLTSGALGTGTAYGDRNGMELTFKGQEAQPANTIVGSLASVFGVPVV